MNNRELARRMNGSGESVIFSFESFKKQYQSYKTEMNQNQNQDQKQMKKMDDEFQSLNSAVNGLKRSIGISNDPRFNRF